MTGKRPATASRRSTSARCVRRCSPATATSTRLRYDFPLVLPRGGRGRRSTCTRCRAIVGRCCAELAPRGIEGERLRKHVLRLERELRVMLAAGRDRQRWPSCGRPPRATARRTMRTRPSARCSPQAGDALKLDGEVVGLRSATAGALRRAGVARTRRRRRAREFRTLVDALMRKLSDIRRAAFARSAAGQQPKALAASIGSGARRRVRLRRDVEAGRRNVPEGRAAAGATAPDRMGARGAAHAAVLRRPRAIARQRRRPGEFAFDNCAAARPRLSRRACRELAEVVKAIAIAELEVRRRATSKPTTIRSSSATTSARSTADDLALFPDYLVCIPRGAQRRAGECGPDRDAVRRPAGEGAGAADRSARGSVDRHRPFRLRRAQRAARHHGDGAGRHVRAAGDERRICTRCASRRARARGARAGAVQHIRRVARGRRRSAAVPDRCGGHGIARVPCVHLRRGRPATTGRTRFSLEHNRNPDADWAAARRSTTRTRRCSA